MKESLHHDAVLWSCARPRLGGWEASETPLPPPLAAWLAGAPPENAKIHSAPLYRLFSRMVWAWGWVCKGGGVGHLSRTPLPTSYSKLPCLRNLP